MTVKPPVPETLTLVSIDTRQESRQNARHDGLKSTRINDIMDKTRALHANALKIAPQPDSPERGTSLKQARWLHRQPLLNNDEQSLASLLLLLESDLDHLVPRLADTQVQRRDGTVVQTTLRALLCPAPNTSQGESSSALPSEGACWQISITRLSNGREEVDILGPREYTPFYTDNNAIYPRLTRRRRQEEPRLRGDFKPAPSPVNPDHAEHDAWASLTYRTGIIKRSSGGPANPGNESRRFMMDVTHPRLVRRCNQLIDTLSRILPLSLALESIGSSRTSLSAIIETSPQWLHAESSQRLLV